VAVSPSSYLAPYARGCGSVEIVAGSQPAAAAGFAFQPPGQFVSLLTSITFQLVTDATVANRSVRLEWDDGNGLIFAGEGSGAVVQASTTARFRYNLDRGAADWDLNNLLYIPLPLVYLQPGQLLRINLTSPQAGDQLSAIVMLWERFSSGHPIEDAPAYEPTPSPAYLNLP
jgi:hypothetical protein